MLGNHVLMDSPLQKPLSVESLTLENTRFDLSMVSLAGLLLTTCMQYRLLESPLKMQEKGVETAWCACHNLHMLYCIPAAAALLPIPALVPAVDKLPVEYLLDRRLAMVFICIIHIELHDTKSGCYSGRCHGCCSGR